ncbi:MAG TPA: TraR/DksA C4-type zinc finger protein [Abditibacteriaceae bacterium]|nr:TraR/DksA C4-type zinc finger protein [Abditibacteriaceae bacterium]
MPAKTKTATTKTAAKPATSRATGKTTERRALSKVPAQPVAAEPDKATGREAIATTAAGRARPTGATAPVKPANRTKKKQGTTDTAQSRSDLDVEHFRSLLLTERARMEAEREQIRNRSLDVDGALPDEGDTGDEDTADLASAMMDKEMDLSVEDEIEDILSAIDHALQKMEDGTYGICDISGKPIPPSRLELIPWASLTVECQALSEGE